MTNKSILYFIQNKINKKLYIGVTNNIEARFKEHKNESSNGHLKNSIKKYGEENFIFGQIAEYDTREQALIEEKIWITNLKKFGFELYNNSNGGETGTYYTRLKAGEMIGWF